MNSPQEIIEALSRLRNAIEYAPGHDHLYGEFDTVLCNLARYRDTGGRMTEDLAREILATVDLLVRENMVGRRPWTGNWETYFSKCMEDAHRLLKLFSSFEGFSAFCPRGYCNLFLDVFAHMDRYDRQYEIRYPHWSSHFARLASLAAEMFSLVADSEARVEPAFLEHPDDQVFTWLLSGYAKSETPRAIEVLMMYAGDDEGWVRNLAQSLLRVRRGGRQQTPTNGEDGAAEP